MAGADRRSSEQVIQLSDVSKVELCEWAQKNDAVKELWLFGSRARGEARPNSDVDITLVLMPPIGKHDWAAGNYFALESDWKKQLIAIVGHDVSLGVITPGSPQEATLERRMIWARTEKKPPA